MSAPLVERRGEVAQLGRALERAASGSSSAVAIEGPDGIGKSALVGELRALATRHGMTVLLARGGEFERDFPFSVVRQLLEPPLAATAPSERLELLSGPGRLAESVLGLADDFGSPAVADSLDVLQSLYWLTTKLADGNPLLLAIDDAHWIDAPSLRWLTFILSRLDELSVLLAVTLRTLAPGAHPLLSSERVEVVRPSPITNAGVAELLRSTLGTEPDPEFARACRDVTGGNPFLVRELLSSIADAGARPIAAEAAGVKDFAPRAVAQAVRLRLLRVGEPAKALAAAVAVLGEGATLRLGGVVARLETASLPELADELAAADVFAGPSSRLEFVHPMIRAAVHDGLPPAERARLHARAALALADAGAPHEEVALHVLSAPPAGEPWVADVLRRTARRATAHGEASQAVACLRRALDEPPAAALRADVLRELGTAELRAGERAALAHLAAARDLSRDPRGRGTCGLELGLALLAHGRVAEGVDVLERAIEEVGPADRELSLRLEAELLAAAQLHMSARGDARSDLTDERAERLTGATPAERLMLATLALNRALAGEPATTVVSLAQRALGDGGSEAPHCAHSRPLNQAAYALLVADRLEAAGEFYERGLHEARARGSVVGVATASCWLSHVRYRQGAVGEAAAEARNALEAAELGLSHPAACAFLGDALIEQGDLDGAEAALAGSSEPASVMAQALLYSRGVLRLAQASFAEALELLLECGERQRRWGAANPAVIPWRSAAAVVRAKLGEHEPAGRLVAEELALARSFGAPRAIGIALRAAGEVSGGRRGIALLEDAVAVLAPSQARLEHARALVDLGAARRRAGQRSAARQPLLAGLELSRVCEAQALEERARTELLAAGARPRRFQRSGVDALTPSELRVAEMAADGLGNREIAQALLVTSKTIETHLRSVYLKLALGSRRELAEALARR